MSVTTIGLFGDIALFADEQGPAEIPVRELAWLHYLSDVSADCKVTHLGRRFHRDTLGAVKRDFENGDLPVLDPCDQCHDEPATQAMGDGKTFCARCCHAAAGSRYDDREDYS